jgi:hypothetical protein
MTGSTIRPRKATIVMTSMPEAKTTLTRISTLLNDSAATMPGHIAPNCALRANAASLMVQAAAGRKPRNPR